MNREIPFPVEITSSQLDNFVIEKFDKKIENRRKKFYEASESVTRFCRHLFENRMDRRH